MVPGDKSISHRALMVAGISKGISAIRGLSSATDVRSTQNCLENLGIKVEVKKEELLVEGNGLRGLHAAMGMLDAGNSGTTIRLLTGILAGQHFDSKISGDDSLQQRPMRRIIEPLTAMGALIAARLNDVVGQATPQQTPPLHIHGSRELRGMRHELQVPSAQVKSSILLAGLYAEGRTEVVEPTITRDHTERMLGLRPTSIGGKYSVRLNGGMNLDGRRFDVPGDISSAAFLIVAALIVPGSEIRIEGVGLNPTRTAFIDVLKRIGASIQVEHKHPLGGEPVGDIAVQSSELAGSIRISPEMVPGLIDEIPILTVAGLFSSGTFEVRGAKDLRVKESDRVLALVSNLRSMGVEVEEYEDGFAFENKKELAGATINSFGDHRIAMAFAVAALQSSGDTIVEGAEAAAISYPEFWDVVGEFQS